MEGRVGTNCAFLLQTFVTFLPHVFFFPPPAAEVLQTWEEEIYGHSYRAGGVPWFLFHATPFCWAFSQFPTSSQTFSGFTTPGKAFTPATMLISHSHFSPSCKGKLMPTPQFSVAPFPAHGTGWAAGQLRRGDNHGPHPTSVSLFTPEVAGVTLPSGYHMSNATLVTRISTREI